MKKRLYLVLDDAEMTLFESNAFIFFDSILCDRERLPECITTLLPKVLHKVFIPWEEIADFKKDEVWLKSKISPELEEKLQGSFFKLSGRSSKDSSIPKFETCKQVVVTVDDSPRWSNDLLTYKKYQIGTYLWFLEWLDDCSIDKEVRIFVKDMKVQAVTAYNYKNKIYNFSDDFMEKAKIAVEEKILNVMLNMSFLKKTWDLTEFVIDAYQRADGSVQFIEVNPYWHSDLCCIESYKHLGEKMYWRNDR